MDTKHYLQQFQQGADTLDRKALAGAGLQVKVGIWLNSVVLKMQKAAWQNPGLPMFDGGIFFSVWINDDTIGKGHIYYNIHALKLRELKTYHIKARDFADDFRQQFKPFEQDWPNVSTSFGPLTLMEGWVDLDENTIDKLVNDLARRFLLLAPVIDALLFEAKK